MEKFRKPSTSHLVSLRTRAFLLTTVRLGFVSQSEWGGYAAAVDFAKNIQRRQTSYMTGNSVIIIDSSHNEIFDVNSTMQRILTSEYDSQRISNVMAKTWASEPSDSSLEQSISPNQLRLFGHASCKPIEMSSQWDYTLTRCDSLCAPQPHKL